MAPNDPPRTAFLAQVPFAAGVVGVASATDFALGKLALTSSSLLAAFGLGIGAGTCLGALFAGPQWLLHRAPRWLQALAWVLIGGLLAAWLIEQLGVLARLGGKDHADAVAALVASVGAGSLLGILGLLVQPSTTAPGWLSRTRWRPLWAGPLLVLLAGAFIVADRKVGLDAYAEAHNALRVMALLMLSITSVLLASYWPRRLRLPSWGRWLGAVLLALPFMFTLSVVGKDRDILAGLLARPFSDLSLSSLRAIADIDQDTYSPIFGGTDCAPFSPSIHPFARDIPGNGIDENCKLGDAPVVPENHELPPIPVEPAPISVVLITIDTLRADHTTWGGKRDTTPNMNKWSVNAARFMRAYSSSSWTSLALSSLFRGVYPRRLVWNPFFETNKFRLLRSHELDQLDSGEQLKLRFGLPSPERYTPLQTLLKRRGMYTAAVIDDGVTGFLDASSGAYPDFDEYHEVSGKTLDVAVTDQAIEVLDGQRVDRPFFLWAHYFGPHANHTWHRGVPRWGNSVAGKYDHEIGWTDLQVGRLLEHIDLLAEDRPIAVIITSDHGENLNSTHRTHGVGVGEDNIRVPLVVRGPGFDPGPHGSLVSTIDIVPTILAWTKTPGPSYLDGIDLAGVITTPSSNRGRILFAETWRFTAEGKATHNMVTAFDGSLKLLCNLLNESVSARRQANNAQHPSTDPKFRRLQNALDGYLEQTGPPDFRD